ncbi:YceI family protein [Flavobacteriaceae bacterium TP-CH-4]|uniref:YceI family protein n=1 Tax=Pelagihabitans pacificus TaxID=2696054 RepID=A0A967E7X5_9FLAO|nr:YceI family protein [Pelagihabitans pacificus]NHF60709.1 YceI family protein [Pelagihabitans pacificus]
MRTKLLLLSFLTLLSLHYTTTAQEQSFNLKKSSLEWTGKAAFDAYSLTGTIKAKKGNLKVVNGQITKLTVTIDMKSLDHDNNNLKTHLRGSDFFEVKTYPTATFVLNEPVTVKEGEVVLKGNMTIKKTTMKESIKVKLEKVDEGIKLSLDHLLDRTLYGVEYNSPSIFESIKKNAIADEFQLNGVIVFEN